MTSKIELYFDSTNHTLTNRWVAVARDRVNGEERMWLTDSTASAALRRIGRELQQAAKKSKKRAKR